MMREEESDDSGEDFGLSEDYDYEVDDNSDKFKTLSDKTLLYFIENYSPEGNNSKLVGFLLFTKVSIILWSKVD